MKSISVPNRSNLGYASLKVAEDDGNKRIIGIRLMNRAGIVVVEETWSPGTGNSTLDTWTARQEFPNRESIIGLAANFKNANSLEFKFLMWKQPQYNQLGDLYPVIFPGTYHLDWDESYPEVEDLEKLPIFEEFKLSQINYKCEDDLLDLTAIQLVFTNDF